MGDEYDVWFTGDPGLFLDRAGAVLARDPVTGTVVATVARRFVDNGVPDDLPYAWFAVVTDAAGETVGIAMRTAPFLPQPVYVLAMPEGAAVALARAVLARGEPVDGVNGLRPPVDVFARAVADETGRTTRINVHHRLFALGTLVPPRVVPGRLRPVRADERELALDWFHQFSADADEQAGRSAGSSHGADHVTIRDIDRKIAEGVLWFWVDETDRPVHLTGANPPAFGVARIGPVFTPTGERGRGWAGAAVAEVSRRFRSAGHRPILFTDQANPTSNALYERLGYQPVVDMAEVQMVGAPSPGGVPITAAETPSA